MRDGQRLRVLDSLVATGVIAPELNRLKRVSDKRLGNHRHELVVGDIRDRTLALAAGKDVDVIVHLAACTGVVGSIEDPFEDCDVNVRGTLNCLESARRNECDAFVLASSGAPLGEQNPPVHEEMVPKPISPYGASKMAGEAYCRAYHGSFGLRAMALRFSNAYGPHSRHKTSVIGEFIRRAVRGETLVVYGNGSQTRDFIHVSDIVEAIIRATERGRGGEVYQIATQTESSVAEVARLVGDAVGECGGGLASVVHKPSRKGEVHQNYADITKARTELGWEPRRGLEEGIRGLVQWWRNAEVSPWFSES